MVNEQIIGVLRSFVDFAESTVYQGTLPIKEPVTKGMSCFMAAVTATADQYPRVASILRHTSSDPSLHNGREDNDSEEFVNFLRLQSYYFV